MSRCRRHTCEQGIERAASAALPLGPARLPRRARVRSRLLGPDVFFPDYEVEIDDATAQQIELSDPADALVLVIVSLGERAQDATANLLGPIVVNIRNNSGVQAVLSETSHGTRVPLMAA